MPTAFVLPGGGAKGPYQIGVMRLLGERKLVPEGARVVVCCSVGAVNGLALATFQPGPDQIADAAAYAAHHWTTSLTKTSQVWTKRFPPYVAGAFHPSIGDNAPLKALLERIIEYDKIAASGVRLILGAVDLITGRECVMDERPHKGALIQQVAASSSFPLMFPPEQIGDKYLTDWGVVTIAPLGVAIKAGCERIITICNRNPADIEVIPREQFKNTIDVGLRIIDLMEHEILRNDIKLAELTNLMVDAGLMPGKKKIKLETIYPSAPLGDPLDFSVALTRKRMELGYEDAKKFWSVAA